MVSENSAKEIRQYECIAQNTALQGCNNNALWTPPQKGIPPEKTRLINCARSHVIKTLTRMNKNPLSNILHFAKEKKFKMQNISSWLNHRSNTSFQHEQ